MPHVPAARGSFLFPSWLLPGDRFWVEFFSPTFCSLVHLFIPSFRRPLIENAGAGMGSTVAAVGVHREGRHVGLASAELNAGREEM